jgi:hypothetical protein
MLVTMAHRTTPTAKNELEERGAGDGNRTRMTSLERWYPYSAGPLHFRGRDQEI